MQHSFSDFIRHGGNGQYGIARRDGRIVGRHLGLSLKSTFPNYSALKADFSDRLDQVIAENTLMFVNALTPPDTVPTFTEADRRDVSDAKAEALAAWDVRLESIFREYQNHQQRLRPLRTAMEERLLLAFAGLINQLRQEDLGIVQYIWRSRDDAKPCGIGAWMRQARGLGSMLQPSKAVWPQQPMPLCKNGLVAAGT